MKRLPILISVLVLSAAPIASSDPETQTDELQKQARELAEKRQELLEKQIEILKQQLELMRREAPGSRPLLAMQSILDHKLSQERVRSALLGARIVAADGAYLGRLGPTYDGESIFCSYGKYGASYSQDSIWCEYGKYGASYNNLSPFCSYSMNPPKIMVDGVAVASLTVGWIGLPVPMSPHALKAIFADE